MNRRWTPFFIGLLLLALTVAACGRGKAAATPTPEPTATPAGASAEVIAAGKAQFARSCSACHGADAKGVTGLGKDLTGSDFVKGLNDEELLDFIKVGRASSDPDNTTGVDMPPKGGNPALTDEQLTAVIAYMRSIEE